LFVSHYNIRKGESQAKNNLYVNKVVILFLHI
jgi:hypothetical protein